MKIKVKAVTSIIHTVLLRWGFTEKDADIIQANMLEAELSGKKSHGFTNLFWYKDVSDGKYGPLNKSGPDPAIIKETGVSLTIDGNEKTGYVVMDFALNMSLRKAKTTGLVATTLTRTAPTIGFIGQWAKIASKSGYIFICFSNAGNSTAPFGLMKKLVGTNPVTVGIPSGKIPVILDMATAASTYATLMRSKALGLTLKENAGLDKNGKLTNDPIAILADGMLIPFGGYKGSGLSLVTELFAGALTGSKTGSNGTPYWGTFFMLLDPALFCKKEDFYNRVQSFINELKKSPSRPGITEVYFPGEKSQVTYEKNLRTDGIEIDDNFFDRINQINS